MGACKMQLGRARHSPLWRTAGTTKSVGSEAATTKIVAALAAPLPAALSSALALAATLSTEAPTAAAAPGRACQLTQLLWDGLANLLHGKHHLPRLFPLLHVEEGDSHPRNSSTPCSANTVNVILSTGCNVEVHDQLHALDIKATCSNVSSSHDRRASCLERVQSLVTLPLLSISMNCHTADAVIPQVLGELIAHALRVDEDDDTVRRVHVGQEFSEPILLLPLALHDHHLLLDVLVRRCFMRSDLDVHGAPQVVCCQVANLTWPSGTEHHRLAVAWDLLDEFADLGLETHVQHAVSLVKHQVHAAVQQQLTPLQVVIEPAGRAHNEMPSLPHLAKLWAARGTPIDAH
mmetsp:Transcript_16918/g.39774  ORF Transcript_16918/g.39774 Transcript_16918/m.39774 type:complete len:348 (+) Transcript_16918:394-1437(+)